MPHPPSRFLSGLLPLVLVLITSGALLADWPTYHGDYSLAGYSAETPREAPVRLWRTATLGAPIVAPPVSEGERLFALTERGKIVAISFSGETVWSRTIIAPPPAAGEALAVVGEPVAASIVAPLTVADGLLIVSTETGVVVALDPATGRTRWSTDLGTPIQGAVGFEQADAASVKRLMVLTQPDGMVHALAHGTGEVLWQAKATARSDGHAAVAGGRVVFGSCAAAFHIVDSATGKLSGEISLGEGCEMAGGVAVDAGRAYGGNRSGQLVCLDLAGGEVVWSFGKSEGELFTTPAVGAGVVAIAGGDGILYLLEQSDGSLRWQYSPESDLSGDPVIAGTCVVFAASGTLTMVSLDKGARLWSTRVSDEITSPALIGGMIVVGADDGTLSAYK